MVLNVRNKITPFCFGVFLPNYTRNQRHLLTRTILTKLLKNSYNTSIISIDVPGGPERREGVKGCDTHPQKI